MEIDIRPLSAEDYEHATSLWASAEGIRLRDDETLDAFRRFLSHNDGLSLGAWSAGCLLGAVMVGHDTRRAYLYHFAVAADRQREGIGRRMAEAVYRRLRNLGIGKAYLFVFADNAAAMRFWEALGWEHRGDIAIFSNRIRSTDGF